MNDSTQAIPPPLADLAENFALFGDWEERYRYLIDLGKRIPPFPEISKVDANLVRGCTSRVWMIADWQNGKLNFQADSDAQIIKGLIYVLQIAYQGQTREEIATLDINKAFEALGLNQHLSPNRRNGFFAMVTRVRAA